MFWFAILIMYVNIVGPPNTELYEQSWQNFVLKRKAWNWSAYLNYLHAVLSFIQVKCKEKIGTMHQKDIKNFLMFIIFVNLRAFALHLRLVRIIFFVKVVPSAKK